MSSIVNAASSNAWACEYPTRQCYRTGYTADLLKPIADSTLANVFVSPIVGADDTHLKTLDKSRKRGTFRGRIWCLVGSDGGVGGREMVAYGYTPSWEATEITDRFSAIDGSSSATTTPATLARSRMMTAKLWPLFPSERRLG